MKRLIIPSAIYVPEELRSIGKLPAIVYPIDEEIVFDVLYRQYNGAVDKMDVICYEGSATVHSQLKKYVSDKIRLIDLPYLKDLGHTLYYALEHIENEPVIINFSDTIVMDNIFDEKGDCFFYSNEQTSDRWTFFEHQNGVITEIYDKTNNYINDVQRMFVGVFQIIDAKYFRICLEDAFKIKDLTTSTFFCAVKAYSEKYPMKPIATDKWFDIGHMDKYYNSYLEVKARKFNHISIDKERSILRKTSDDTEKFIGEILWYLKLPADIEYVRPRIFNYSVSYTDPFVEMEYYSYHTIHELFLFGNLNRDQWTKIFKRIKFICDDFARYTIKGEKIKSSLKNMYLDKTLNRLSDLRNDKIFKRFFENDFRVNNIWYVSIEEILIKLKDVIPSMLYDVDTFNIIHGDLCFANIMIDSTLSFIKVVDPRGKFGDYDIYGDVRYELAKLLHSIDGKYDFIIKDMFTISVGTDESAIDYVVNENQNNIDLYKIFNKIFAENINNNIKPIELIESLLFLSMIPLHSESIRHQFAMLATGVQILDRIIDIRKEI